MEKNFYIITGGPGAGKTTLLNELEKSGYQIIPEVARQIIKEQVAMNGNGLPWKDKILYTDLMLNASLESYKLVEDISSVHFFDRGILDTLCYAEMTGLGISVEMDRIAKTYSFNRKVFILPPWFEIYQTDNERKQTWEEAIFTFQMMRDIYIKYGYEPIEVPKCDIECRKDFILASIKL